MIQGNLRKTTDSLSTSFERLASGMRINSAKDDPAGLALATQLNTKSKVFSQAIRNANDGISLLNTAEVAASELTNILSRLSELATQASNGVLTRTQRVALHAEGRELTEEYNRILTSSEFNSRKLLDGSFGSITLQVSDDSQNNISFEVGEELARTIGDGTFQGTTTTSVTAGAFSLSNADFNGDGRIDIIYVSTTDDNLHIRFGNGDGTFQASVTYAAGNNPTETEVGDFDNDGDIDIVTHSTVDGVVDVFLNNGDGTFAARVSYDVGLVSGDLGVADFDGDGSLDIVSFYRNDNEFRVLLNDGNGAFGAAITTNYDWSLVLEGLDTGDVNGDGIADIVSSDVGLQGAAIALGNGDGTFKEFYSYSAGTNPAAIQLQDLNQDGALDIVLGGLTSNTIEILLGNGDGTFASSVSYASVHTSSLAIADINGDGYLDIGGIDTLTDTIRFLIGKGDGTFVDSSTSYSIPDTNLLLEGLQLVDLDNDGAVDITALGNVDSQLATLLANTTEVNTLPSLDLSTQAAAIESQKIISAVQDNVLSELGNLGATQSRLDFTTSVLTTIRDEYTAAESRIVDLDVAREVAEMVRLQVLQQATAAVLAQANLNPQIALSLLSASSK